MLKKQKKGDKLDFRHTGDIIDYLPSRVIYNLTLH